MKKIDKNQKYGVIAAVAIIVVALAATWFGQSDTLQGWLELSKGPMSYKQVYKWKNKYVTPVASPVTSVVVSTVTSPAGPSLVASAVTSPVASPVQISQSLAATLDLTRLPTLTANVLKAAARADYLSNPARYRLSNTQRLQIINMYKVNHPNAFIITR